MKTIRIIEFQGRPVCGGIAVFDGIMLMPGGTIEVADDHPLLKDKQVEIVPGSEDKPDTSGLFNTAVLLLQQEPENPEFWQKNGFPRLDALNAIPEVVEAGVEWKAAERDSLYQDFLSHSAEE